MTNPPGNLAFDDRIRMCFLREIIIASGSETCYTRKEKEHRMEYIHI